MDEGCSSCYFMRRRTVTRYTGSGGVASTTGPTCSYHPPIVSPSGQTLWPIVGEDDWCSRYSIDGNATYGLAPSESVFRADLKAAVAESAAVPAKLEQLDPVPAESPSPPA